MDFTLSPDQQILRQNVIEFSRRELNDSLVARDRDEIFPRESWRKCADMGLLSLPVPESHGGAALDPLSCAIALEALGYGCRDGGLSFSICAHLLACVVPVWKHGTNAQQDRLLRGLCDGTLVGAHALTEPNTGSDAFSMASTASRESGGWRLNGTKTFVSNGPVANVVVVFAMTNATKGAHGGMTAFLVEPGTAGCRTGQRFDKMGLRTSPVGELVLDDAYVADDAVLGTVGGGAAVFNTAMDWERALLGAVHVGAMERLLETSVAYARTRVQFGQPIGKFQAVSHKIADMKVHLEAARLLLYRTASRLDTARSVSLDAAITKLFISESLVSTAMDSLQLHGGNGYMVEYELERAVRDAIGSTIYSGTSELQRNIIARWLGL